MDIDEKEFEDLKKRVEKLEILCIKLSIEIIGG